LLKVAREKSSSLSIPDLCGKAIEHWIGGRRFTCLEGLRARLPRLFVSRLRHTVSLSDYNAFGTLGEFGFFKGEFIRGHFAQLSHAMLYRRHQQALHGFGKASLLWAAERINALVQPKIRLK
jgi:hypothetical protein